MNAPFTIIQSIQPDTSEIVAKIIALLSISLLPFFFGLQTHNVQYRYMSYSKWLVIMLYIFSWAYTALSMLLVTTNNGNYTSCLISILSCDVLYCAAKITIYIWLAEKVYVVSASRKGRWNTPSYKFHMALLSPYVAIFILMLTFHRVKIEDDDTCVIGLGPAATYPLIIYDFVYNLYMTVLFIKPLMNMGGANTVFENNPNSRLHQVALRTLIASIVCLIVSFANIFALILLGGRERGVLCLICCTLDVTINVITIHWVTTQSPKKHTKDTDLDHTHLSESANGMAKHQHERILGFKDIELTDTYSSKTDPARSSGDSTFVPSYDDSTPSHKILTHEYKEPSSE
ncbi:hypothetical protein BY458DRAFT_521071 [Sporodiniella umbellata]|nr:hypothetical protein BY458DRAFT_521071 [Sporodiniella umbellata]